MNTTTNPEPLPISAAAIARQTVDQWAEKARGRPSEIAKLLSELTGERYTRQMVERWLHPDPDKRNVPNMGASIALALVMDKLADPDGAAPTEDHTGKNHIRVARFTVTTKKPRTKTTRP